MQTYNNDNTNFKFGTAIINVSDLQNKLYYVYLYIMFYIEQQHDGDIKYFKDMALHIKKELEEKF